MTQTADPTVYECNTLKTSCGCSVNDVGLSSLHTADSEEAIPHSWAMVVSIRLDDPEEHSCEGSILTDSYILTSAHCVDGASPLEVSVVAGIHNRIEDYREIRYVREIYTHPHWNVSDGSYRNDIAILRIAPPLPVGGRDTLARTCVSNSGSADETVKNPLNGSHLAIVGWDSTQYGNHNMSDTLQQVGVYAIGNNDPSCLQSIYDIEKQFCAGTGGGGNNSFSYYNFPRKYFSFRSSSRPMRR